jgi:hypothetical protein
MRTVRWRTLGESVAKTSLGPHCAAPMLNRGANQGSDPLA